MHEKRLAWFSISMHACGSVSIVIVLCFGGLLDCQSSALNTTYSMKNQIVDSKLMIMTDLDN